MEQAKLVRDQAQAAAKVRLAADQKEAEEAQKAKEEAARKAEAARAAAERAGRTEQLRLESAEAAMREVRPPPLNSIPHM